MSNTNSSGKTTPINRRRSPNTKYTTITTTGTRVSPRRHHSSAASQACAACKYQRRRCGPDCPLAPHFPPNHPKNFLNAQKLFGVCNIMRVLKMVHPSQQQTAAKSMIVHANIRANDPVGGCYQIIRELQRQIDQSKAEFELVLQQLAIYGGADARKIMGHPSLAVAKIGSTGDHDSGNIVDDVDTLCVYGPVHVQAVVVDYDYRRFDQVQQQPLYMDLYDDHNVGVVKVDMEEATSSSSSSMMVLVNDAKQILVDHESEDIKPLR